MEVKNSVKPVDYNKSIKILEKRVNDLVSGKKGELLWILEHKTVYTAGSSSSSKDLISKKTTVIKTTRGGKHTIHSPGQKVIYFVLDLNKRGKNIRKLVNKIETCIINILKEYNINSYADSKNIGIWIKQRKKMKNKTYHHHTGYPGGLKSITAEHLMEKKPTEVVNKAIRGMLPKTPLGKQMAKKLRIYAGADHPHSAQNPEPWS